MEQQYRERGFGGLDSDELKILLAADEAASLVAANKITLAQGYSYIAQVRADVNDRNDARSRAAWQSYQQQQNNIFNSLLNSQRRTTNCRSTVIGNTVNTNCN